MIDYLTLGPTPCEEDCVQVGEPDYMPRAELESERFIKVIRKELGPEPFGAALRVKTFNHEFGLYVEVVCYYDDKLDEAVEYAFRCESDAPSCWGDGCTNNHR